MTDGWKDGRNTNAMQLEMHDRLPRAKTLGNNYYYHYKDLQLCAACAQ